MYKFILIGVAGMIGTLARHLVSGWADQRWGVAFPVGTVIVNLTGCLLAGFLFQAMEERYVVDPVVRAAILVGFLGGFTTFSSYALQTFALLGDGKIFLASANLVLSNVAGLFLVWTGYALAKSL